MNLLARLVAESEAETERRKALVSVHEVFKRAAGYTPRDFEGAIAGKGLAVIAEMKQRTPSMGVLTTGYEPDRLAETYTRGGAAAISVLTQEASFGGSLEHIRLARANTSLPILRKDFITDPYQVFEAREAGADAVLLIVAALPDFGELMALMLAAESQGLAALVEVHNEPEAEIAVACGARIIGVNNRDLNTFEVDLGLTERLRAGIPRDVLVVAESGIHGAADATRMRQAGASAVLVGEMLMRSSDPGAAIRELASA